MGDCSISTTVTRTQVVSMGGSVTIGLVDCSRSNTNLPLTGFDNIAAVP